MRTIISALVIYETTWEIKFDLDFEKWAYEEEQRKGQSPGSKALCANIPGYKRSQVTKMN